MIENILDYFPDKYKPSKQQVEIINELEKAFTQGHKFVVCNAPTGSGKSLISKTLGNIATPPSESYRELIFSYAAFKQAQGGGYANAEECREEQPFGALALTITKTLQDQYNQLFGDIKVLKGKSNYKCAIDENFTVEVAPCVHLKHLKEECWAKNKCPYYNARNEALASKFATLNYTMFFALPDHLKYRDYIICDEASELEDQLVKHFTCDINFTQLKKVGVLVSPFVGSDYTKAERWLNTLTFRVKEKLEEVKEEIGRAVSKQKKVSEDKKYCMSFLQNLHSKLTLVIDTWQESEYVFDTDVRGVVFKPLKVDKLSDILFKYGKRVILLSATIIDHKNFCKTLGIEKYHYIEVDSPFKSENAPILVNTKTKLSYNNLKQNLPKIKKQIAEICERHKNEKGLIHTHTNAITKYLQDTLHGNRFLFREPGINNETILQQHALTDQPTVLVSPSMSYGVDLKDDLARFQIIIKAPYLPMGDSRVEKMMKVDKQWYVNKMLCALIQACGRGVRSPSDHCVTYILDGAIVESVITNKQKLPKYFINRFI